MASDNMGDDTADDPRGDTVYGHAFYADRDRATRQAAARILPPLIGALRARTVADVGCGVGTWLAAALEAGAETVQGFEGSWLDPALLVIGRDRVTLGDLETSLPAGTRADLVLCLEVAEHLSDARAPGLVRDLAGVAGPDGAVLFGAAIPGQGGQGHVNERWQSWWAARFAEAGFAPFDVVRPAVWSDPDIPFWYRQNTLVYARPDGPAAARLTALGPGSGPLDVIHPALWRHRLERPGVRHATHQMGRALGRALGRAASGRLGREQGRG